MGLRYFERGTMREYCRDDLEDVVALFYDTIHNINIVDYSKEQCDAWASVNPDLNKWHQSLSEHYTLVVYDGDRLVGFGDCDRVNYLDRLFVHKDYQGRGIASQLCDELEEKCRDQIMTYASITALPFFEKRGYQVETQNEVIRNGVILQNTLMRKIKET